MNRVEYSLPSGTKWLYLAKGYSLENVAFTTNTAVRGLDQVLQMSCSKTIS